MGLSFRAELAPSRRARSLRQLALTLTASAAAACLAALLLAPAGMRLAGALAAIAALGYAVLRPATPRATQVVVAADGTLRIEDDGERHSATVGYCGERLICLRAAGRRVAVWPDALARPDWRRLLVACRWPHAPGRQPRKPAN